MEMPKSQQPNTVSQMAVSQICSHANALRLWVLIGVWKMSYWGILLLIPSCLFLSTSHLPSWPNFPSISGTAAAGNEKSF